MVRAETADVRHADSQTWVEIDLGALRHNIARIRGSLRGNTQVLAVVKSDAYGHGAVPCARAALEAGANRLAVGASLEAKALREAGLPCPVLRLVPTVSEDDLALGAALKLEEVAVDVEHAAWMNEVAARQGVTIPIHVKVDTGMGRLGVWWTEAGAAIAAIRRLDRLRVVGVMTHCPESEAEDAAFAREQIQRMRSVLAAQNGEPGRPPLVHLANSAGSLFLPDGHFDLVRAGIAMYGLSPRGPYRPEDGLRPVMSVKSPVLQVKETPAGETVGYGRTYPLTKPARIAVIPAGYADGMFRSLSNRGEVLLHGRRAPIAGIVSMNLMAVDVTGMPEVRRGDAAVLIGASGNEMLTAHDMAVRAGTIHYEVVTRIGQACRRVYAGQARDV